MTHRTWNTVWDLLSNINQSGNVSINLNQTGKSHNVVTYDDCLWIRVGQGLMQSVEKCCRYLTHCLHVGEQPVYIHNLTEDKEHKWKSKFSDGLLLILTSMVGQYLFKQINIDYWLFVINILQCLNWFISVCESWGYVGVEWWSVKVHFRIILSRCTKWANDAVTSTLSGGS